ncbi:MAG: PEP-CTERM sorting domain-containing protein [Bryobacteraceae bacterium]
MRISIASVLRKTLPPAVIFLAVPASIWADGYTFTSISDMVDNNPPNTKTPEVFTQLLGVNTADMVAGYYGSGANADHPNKGFVMPNAVTQPTTFTHENFPGSVQTQVVGINSLSSPTTVGFYIDGNGTNHGFADIGNTFTTFDNPSTPASAGTVNQLLGVNNHNVAAGYYTNAAGNFVPYTVNVAGSPVFTSLSGVGTNSQATDINNGGWISGFTMTSSSTSEGFVDENGTETLLNFGTSTAALGLNDNGQVVGDYVDANGVQHGFIYWLSTASLLTVDPPGSTSTTINGINDMGGLVGFYTDSTGVNVIGTFGTPTPEPASIALLGLGALALGFWQRKRLRA